MAATVAQAGDCSQLKDAARYAEDGQLYRYNEGRWKAVAPNENLSLPIGRTATFTYVTRESWKDERSGVIVVKSGRLRNARDPVRQTVMLVRKDDGTVSNKKCGDPRPYALGFVTSANYDAYHDKGEETAQLKEFKAFHVHYAARGENCRDTDSTVSDSLFAWDFRSNRSQFSFDHNVAFAGTYSRVGKTLLAWGMTTSAYAGSSNLIDQRVEIKRYNNPDQKPVCTAIKVMVTGPAAFLRISDLESVDWNGSSVARSQEKSWQLTP